VARQSAYADHGCWWPADAVALASALCLRRTVIVNTKTKLAFRGVLWEDDAAASFCGMLRSSREARRR